ncbi:restriction endonuclease subunit S [Paenibacillus amylolyticus]|uniref:restriction endonuclease subunit S n=1 Tax=Paenibacillus amylolyticus TaxID=1451 RepID=UPI003D2AD8E1
MGNNYKPEIRFSEFTDAWEQRELSDVAQISSGGTPNRKKSSYWNGTVPWVTTAEVNYSLITDTNEKITLEGLNSSSAKLLPIGTILMAMYGQGKTRGKVAILGIEATTNQANANIVVTPIVNNLFIYYQLEKQYEILRNLANEGGQANLSLGIIKNIPMFVSSNLSEQEKIGDLFKQFDHLITLHQRKLDNAKKLKAGFLQKMFPRNGESFPEIRFPGFTDAWEQRQLNEYLTTSKVKNRDEQFGKEDVLSVSGDFGIVNQIEFQGRSFAGVSVAPYGVVETGDVVYTKSPLKSNPFGIIKTNKGQAGIVSTLYAVYKPNDNVDSIFVERYFENDQRLNRYLKPLVNKGAKNDMKVSDDNALIGTVVFPVEVDEQRKISSFFNQLENLITLHQRELDGLKETKKAFLQKMFV